MTIRAGIVAAACALLACVWCAGAAASPVATSDQQYDALGAVFPDPHAGCQNLGDSGQPCSPWARGNVPAQSFVGINEFISALEYMNRRPEWSRYMEVWPLDGKIGDGSGTAAGDAMFPGNNLSRLEWDPEKGFESAGIPRSDRTRRKSDLIAVRVTDETVPDEGKKRYALSLSIHGIERAGAEGGIRAMEDLVTAFTTGRGDDRVVPAEVKEGAPTFADILRKTIIYFTFPNPDGWRRGSVSSGGDGGVFFQRYNGNGVDPNRDWPDIGFAFRPYSSVSEPETRAWIDFYGDIKRKTGAQFAAGDDLHGQPHADALSFTLLPHGRHDFGKDLRIKQTAQRINRGTYERIKWSPIVQENDQPTGGGAPCVTGQLGTSCAKIYAQTWGSVYDTINYTTTGALGDWFDSSIGLGADGIDNEMSFSHIDKNILFESQTEQLHVDGNKALIYAHLAEILDPPSGSFQAGGTKGYVPGTRVTREERTVQPGPPAGTEPQPDHSADGTAPPGEFPFQVLRGPQPDGKNYSNGGMRVEVTSSNVQGIGTGLVTLKVQCRNCEEHPGVEEDEDWITVAEDYNQSFLYAQAGVVATVNRPQAVGLDGKPVEWRALVGGPAGPAHVEVHFTSGPASEDGDTGGGEAPVLRGYDVANTDFFQDLNRFVDDGGERLNQVDPRAVLVGDQDLTSFDTLVLADDPLPGYLGAYGGVSDRPTGPPTADQDIAWSQPTAPGGGQDTPANSERREFTIEEGAGNEAVDVRVGWENGANDFDLYVYRKDPSSGEEALVGSSAGGPPQNVEHVTIPEPPPATYVVEVRNFAAPDFRWNGTVRFTRASESGDTGTGAYTDAQKDQWIAKLREYVQGGGNLVLTDRALLALSELVPIERKSIARQVVYAGQSAFGKSEDESTVDDPLARDIAPQGARFNSGFRRQMFEPTPLGFAIQNAEGADSSFARQYDVDRAKWEEAGGRTVATSADSGARDASAVYSRVTIGELPMGQGRIRIAGALLPQPTEKFDHTLGLEPYAVTYTGYTIVRNLLDAPR